MLTYKELKEKCSCWTGYKRKPGTKPFADGSCIKEEVSSAEKHHAMVFGRMNPITTGHEAVVNKLHSVAQEHNAGHSLVVSHSQDAKKNPLSAEQKVQHAKNAFPKTNVSASSKEKPTILHHAAELHKQGVTHLHVVAGSDREKDMHDLLHKYNGQNAAHGHYNFKKITVHSSGERDPDSEGTTGISASKMREHAASGNKTEFHKGAPSTMSAKHKDAMYNDVRKGMNLKEETQDQQDDRAAQLKRFKDQMTKLNGPNVDTEISLDKKEKDIMTGKKKPVNKTELGLSKEEQDNLADINEHLTADMGAGAWINDFVKSTNTRFNNKSKAERRKMAIGAYMAAKAKGMKEETEQIDELSTELLGKYKTAAHASAKAADASGNYAKGDKRFKGINKATNKQFDNDLKKHGQMKEGTIQTNGTDQIETSTSAPSASTAKDTTMGKKIKGFKFFNGENDKQMNMNQPIKEQLDLCLQPLEEAAKAIDSGEYDYEGQMARTQLQTILRNSKDLIDMLSDEDNMPEWVQSKITLAQDYITCVRDYLQSKEELGEGFRSYSGRSHGHAYGGGGFGKREREDDEYHVPDPTPVAPTIARKYIKGTPENKAAKAASKPINGHPTNEEVLDEKSDQARRNKTMKNMLDTIRGAKFKLNNPVPDTDHKTAQEKNKAIGRALRNESMTGNPGKGYHGACGTADEKYEEMHKHVKNLTDGDDKTVKHYLDSGHGEKLAGREEDHDHIKSDFKKFMKYYRPEMNDPKPAVKEETAAVGKPQKITTKTAVVKLHPNGVASDTEEGWAKPKIKEGTMKSYTEFLQGLTEASKKKPAWLLAAELKAEKREGKLKEETEELDESTYSSAEQAKNVAAALKQKHNDGNYSVVQTKGGHKVVHAYHGDTKVKNSIRSLSEEKEDSAKDKKQDKAGMKRTGMTAKEWEKSSEDKKEDMQEANWIAGAIKHPGALTAAAKRAGETNAEYEQKHKHDSGKAGRRARLALTLKKMKEERQIDEIKMADVPSRMIKGKSYGADYEDPEGAFETKKDMKKPEKAGRKAGAGAGVYKPRATMSKLKSAGATYK
jgi:hypothetical protein